VVVEKAKGEMLEMVVDLGSQQEEDILSGLLEQVTVDDVQNTSEDVEAEESEREGSERPEVGFDFPIVEGVTDVGATRYILGEDVVDHVTHHEGLYRFETDDDYRTEDTDRNPVAVRAGVVKESDEYGYDQWFLYLEEG
jgi:hypothetical protein